jgi:hypothetical protein
MRQLISILQKHGTDLRNMTAIELFARGGDWHAVAYADEVRSLEVWEIDNKWESDLKKRIYQKPR